MTPEITYRRKVYHGNWHKEVVKILDDGVEVLARFEDDTPAVTRHAYGKGRAIYFATHPDVAYLEEQSYLLWDVLDEILLEIGVKPSVELFFSQQHMREFDGNLLEDDKEGFLIITSSFTGNYSYSSKKERLVDVVIRSDKKIKKLIGMRSGKEYVFKQTGKEIKFSLTINKNDSEIVNIEYEK